jgi:hypothetical protein
LVVLGLGVFFLALAWQFPAAWALHLARDRVPAELAWEGASGSVLDGRVERLAVSLPSGERVIVGPARFELQPLAAITGAVPVTFRVEAYDGEVSGNGRIGLTGWEVADLRGRLSLTALPRVVPELAVAGLKGTLLFRARELAGPNGGAPNRGRAQASLEDLHVGLLQADRPLGAYALRLELTQGGKLSGRVKTVAEDPLLGVEGEVSGSMAEGQVRFRGRGWTMEGAPPGVRDILPLLGQVDDGEVRIRWQGRLP